MSAISREEWLALRRTGLGGSDIAAVMGFNKYKTPLDVFYDKTTDVVDDGMSEAAYWGIRLEQEVAREFSERTGYRVQRVNKMLRHPEHAWMCGNIDRGIVDPEISGVVRWKDGRLTTRRGLECKTANQYLDGEWGEEMTDQVPDSYVCQCQWYMGVTGCEEWYLAALIGGQKFKTYLIRRDNVFIDLLMKAGHAFWHDHVLTGIPPEPVTFADAMQLYGHPVKDKPYYMSDDDIALLGRYRMAKESEKAAKREGDAVKLEIVKRIKDSDCLIYNGQVMATFKPRKTTGDGVTRVLTLKEAA